MMVTRKVVMCMVVMCVVTAGVSHAVPVVRNAGFEADTINPTWGYQYDYYNPTTDWDGGTAEYGCGLTLPATVGSTHPTQFAFLNPDGYYDQEALEADGTTPSLVTADMSLRFTFEAAGDDTGEDLLLIQLWTTDDTWLDNMWVQLNPDDGFDGWQTYTVASSFDEVDPAAEGAIGKGYYYRFYNYSGGQIWLDNVSIEANKSATLISPANTAVDVDKSTEALVWGAPFAGYTPVGYNLYVRANDPNFAAGGNAIEITNGTAASPYDILALDYDTTYYWRVDTLEPNTVPIVHQSDVWSFTTRPDFPRIDTQPAGCVRGPANGKLDAVLTVEAINHEGYQWYYDNGDGIADPATDIELSGEVSDTLTLTGVTLAQEGGYFCVATHSTLPDAVSDIAYVEYARQTSQWDFEGTMVDSIGGHNGSWSTGNNGDAAYDTGIVGSWAIDFPVPADGNSIDVPVAALPRNGKEVTISLWAQNGPIGPVNTYGIVPFTARDSTGANVIASTLPWWDGNVVWITGDPVNAGENGPLVYAANITELEGVWNHWVFVHNSEDGYMAIYRNGVAVASYTGALGNDALGAVSFEIGSANHASDSAYQGLIDDFKIYNYAISAVEAAYLYTDVSGQTVCVEGAGQFDVAGGPLDGEGNPTPDCKVSLQDFAVFAADWMNCNQVPDCLPRP